MEQGRQFSVGLAHFYGLIGKDRFGWGEWLFSGKLVGAKFLGGAVFSGSWEANYAWAFYRVQQAGGV